MDRVKDKLQNEFDNATSYAVGIISAMPEKTTPELNQKGLNLIQSIQQTQKDTQDNQTLCAMMNLCLLEFDEFEQTYNSLSNPKDPNACSYMKQIQIAKNRLKQFRYN
jgi:hypothetical protein